MKKFVFTLEFLLKARQRAEQEVQRELSHARQHRDEQQAAEERLRQQLTQIHYQWSDQIAAGHNAQALLHANHTYALVRSQMQTQHGLVIAAEQTVFHCQEQLRELLCDIKSLKILHDQQYAVYLKAAEHEAARNMDEFVSYKHQQANRMIGNGSGHNQQEGVQQA